MSVDPTGTKPGLARKEDAPETIHMSCKNDNCDSMLAIEIKIAGHDSSRMYQCCKCKMTRSIAVGGSVNL